MPRWRSSRSNDAAEARSRAHKSRPLAFADRCPLSPFKRRKANMPGGPSHAMNRHAAPLLNHLIGAREHRWRYSEADRLCGLEIDDQVKNRRLHHRQVSRLRTLENSACAEAGLAVLISCAGAVTQQATIQREFAPVIDRGNGMPRRERREPFAVGEKHRSVHHQQAADALLCERGKGGLKIHAPKRCGPARPAGPAERQPALPTRSALHSDGSD